MIRAESRPIGGSALARAAMSHARPEWYAAVPTNAAAWAAAVSVVADEFSGRAWLPPLLPALDPSGAAADRLQAAGGRAGVVVTGGQQPGLFGGPLYVLHKAVTLVEMADRIASITGRPVAPVFWAATDDTDYAEASHVSVVGHGRLQTLSMRPDAGSGRSMANTPLGDVSAQLALLEDACGSATDARVLDMLRAAYAEKATVGSAYVKLLRGVLEPLGVAVLDASHAAVRAAGRDTMIRALERADDIAAALNARSRDMLAAGFRAQVANVPNLSLVFETLADGSRRRVPLRSASETARDVTRSVSAGNLGPNVLLRPVMERQILPTVTYVGGAGEISYFAQVSAVAGAMSAASPRIIPRWSGTLLEPHVTVTLTRLNVTVADFADAHAMEGRVARESVSAGVQRGISDLRATLDATVVALRADAQTTAALDRSIGSMRAAVDHRLARLERRYAAAVKQAGSDELREIAMLRATLYPNGVPQERMLSFIPFLARYGAATIDTIRAEARAHVARLTHGD